MMKHLAAASFFTATAFCTIATAQPTAAQPATTQPTTRPAEKDDHVIRLPDGTVIDPSNLPGGMTLSGMSVMKTIGPNGTTTKTKDDDGRDITITETDAGAITVLIEEAGKEAKEYKADNLEQLQKEHPEIAEIYEEHAGGMGSIVIQGMPGGGGGGQFQFRVAGNAVGGFHPDMMHGMMQDLFGASGSVVMDEFIKLQIGGGFRVVRVKADSRAALMGIQKNDLLRSINGNPIESNEDIDKALEADGKLLVEILRAGKPMTLDEK